jgi:hypothetical protein
MNIPAHVLRAFVEPLLAVFGQPSSDDPERFLAEYSRHLKGYASAELQAAADHLMRSHKGPARWPKLAECVDACNDARERQQHTKTARSPQADWQTRMANAERLMISTELGQQAARDGWANGMREFIAAKGRLPREYEIGDLIENARFIDRCAVGQIDMGVMHTPLIRLANVMVERRHAIADRVINGEAAE